MSKFHLWVSVLPLSAALAGLVATPIVGVVGLPARPVAELPLIYHGPLKRFERELTNV